MRNAQLHLMTLSSQVSVPRGLLQKDTWPRGVRARQGRVTPSAEPLQASALPSQSPCPWPLCRPPPPVRMGAFGLRGGAALQGSRTHLCPASSRPKAAGTCCFRVVFPQEHSSFRVNCPSPPPPISPALGPLISVPRGAAAAVNCVSAMTATVLMQTRPCWGAPSWPGRPQLAGPPSSELAA